MRALPLLALLAAPAAAQDLQVSGTLTYLTYGEARGPAPSSEVTGRFGLAGSWDIGSSVALDLDLDAYVASERGDGFIDPALSLRGTGGIDWEAGLLRDEWGQPDGTRLDMLVSPNLSFGLAADLDSVSQPGLRVGLPIGEARLDLYALTGLRTSPLPEAFDRNSFGLPATRDIVEGELGRGALAARLSGSTVALDWGVHAYIGMARTPTFVVTGDPAVIAYHDQIRQVGYDLEAAPGDWRLWSEGFWRTGARDATGGFVDYGHVTLGAEYQVFAAFGGAYDIILGAEYRHDTRGALADQPFQNGIAGGVTILQNAFNGWEAEYLFAYDTETEGHGHMVIVTKPLSETPFIELDVSWSSVRAGDPGTVLDVLETDTAISTALNFRF